MLSSLSIKALFPAEQFHAGELLRGRCEPCEDVLYLDSGRVALGIDPGAGGLRHRLGLVEGPAWLDAAFAVCGRPSSLDMVADSGVQLHRISRASFQSDLQDLPSALRGLVDDMAQAYCQQTELTISRLVQDAEARCAQWLLQYAQAEADGSMRVTLRQRKRLIAAQLGIAPETLSRVLRQLRAQGLITGRGNVLQLPQPAALQCLVGL